MSDLGLRDDPLRSGANACSKVAWRVPTYKTNFGIALDTSLRGLTLLVCRGTHGWKSLDGDYAYVRLAHQVYEADLIPLIADRSVAEVCAIDLNAGKWKTIFAATDDDVNHP